MSCIPSSVHVRVLSPLPLLSSSAPICLCVRLCALVCTVIRNAILVKAFVLEQVVGDSSPPRLRLLGLPVCDSRRLLACRRIAGLLVEVSALRTVVGKGA